MAVYANRTLRAWLESLDDENRELFVDTLYSIIIATGAKTFSDLTEGWWKNPVRYWMSFGESMKKPDTLFYRQYGL
jgi:hypothetical protein